MAFGTTGVRHATVSTFLLLLPSICRLSTRLPIVLMQVLVTVTAMEWRAPQIIYFNIGFLSFLKIN
jgi:hypothetical protein